MERVTEFAISEYEARLTSVEVTGDYSVRVTFSDGVSFEADLRRDYVDPSGKLLDGPEEFALVRLDEESDTLVWQDGPFHEHGEILYEVNASKSSRLVD
jgi:hypothetical protein